MKKGSMHSEKTRKKMSDARKGRKPWNAGKKMSEEYSKKNSLGQKKRFATQKHPMQGRKHSKKSNEKPGLIRSKYLPKSNLVRCF